MLKVRREGDQWWATCPACPGWTAIADSWAELFRLVAEFHALPEARHRGWMMIQPFMKSGA